MDLNTLWFILIAVLFFVYFLLDGMDFGIGMLIPIFGKEDKSNRKMIHTIGPTWGANEVWLITAGGAMFAAFPGWYATMFSGFYLALFLLLLALIIRGISIEFRGKATTAKEKKLYDLGLGIANLLIPLLLAVAIACLLRGVPIDENMEFTGSLLSLFSPFTLLAGITAVSFFLYHGATVLLLKDPTEWAHINRVKNQAGLVVLITAVLTVVSSVFETTIFRKPISAVLAVVTLVLFLLGYLLHRKKVGKLAFLLNAAVVASAIGTIFSALFPNVMVSSTKEAYNLTIYNISSGHYTLSVISAITFILLPVVIGYSVWVYWVFSKKSAEEIEY